MTGAIIGAKAIDKALDNPLLILGAVALVVAVPIFGYKKVVAPVLETVGLKDSKADKQQAKDYFDFRKTAFNPTYWTELSRAGKKFRYYPEEPGLARAKLIWDSNGAWYQNDNEDKVYGVFSSASSLSSISTIAYWFQKKYKRDLLKYLRSFLNDREMRKIYAILKTKPAA